jgi:hypothetical protein
LERFLPEDPSIRELFELYKKTAASHQVHEQLKSIWIDAMLRKRLEVCHDFEIADLLSIVRDSFEILSPEFAFCEHAKLRLQRSSRKTDLHRAQTNELEIPNSSSCRSLHFVLANNDRLGMVRFCCETQPLATIRSHERPKKCPFCKQANPLSSEL